MCFVILIVILYVACDVNYFLRTFFILAIARLRKQKYTLNDTTTIYGICTFQDCDVLFKGMRLARLLREIDFARYHYYYSTGLYTRTKQLNMGFLQASTLTLGMEIIPMFVPYKINTKLIYWDDQSLFLEHKVITLHDNKDRVFLVSRQHTTGDIEEPTSKLLKGLGVELRPACPDYIQCWWKSMLITSTKLREYSVRK